MEKILIFIFSLLPVCVNAEPVSAQGSWEMSLQARDLDGNITTVEAYYDTDLNITWLANANYSFTSGYVDTIVTTVDDGKMTWQQSVAWATSLDLFGYTEWRLPVLTDTGTVGCTFAYSGTDCGFNTDTSVSELGHLFYDTLGNSAFWNDDGSSNADWMPSLDNTGLFSNVQHHSYWTGTTYALSNSDAWHFDFILGHQGEVNKGNLQYAWAVYDGDIGTSVTTVPVPTSIWLMFSGMLLLIRQAIKNSQA